MGDCLALVFAYLGLAVIAGNWVPLFSRADVVHVLGFTDGVRVTFV